MVDLQCVHTDEIATARHFHGHFPGDPILPGVIQLLRAEDAIDPSHARSIRSLSRLKFQRAIRPSDHTTLSISPGSISPGSKEHEYRFAHTNQDAVVCSSGQLSFLQSAASPQKANPSALTDDREYPPFAAFMPHREPMLWLDRMLSHTRERVVVERTLHCDHIGVQDGRASNAIAMELFAQAASAHFGFLAHTEGGGQLGGALLGTRRIDIHVAHLPLDVPLVVEGIVTMTMPPLAQFACRLIADDFVIADGTINVAMGVGP